MPKFPKAESPVDSPLSRDDLAEPSAPKTAMEMIRAGQRPGEGEAVVGVRVEANPGVDPNQDAEFAAFLAAKRKPLLDEQRTSQPVPGVQVKYNIKTW